MCKGKGYILYTHFVHMSNWDINNYGFTLDFFHTEDLAKKDHSHGHTVPRRYADYNTNGLSLTVTADQMKPIEIAIRAAPEE